jgi:hypothetical protein
LCREELIRAHAEVRDINNGVEMQVENEFLKAIEETTGFSRSLI